MDSDGALLLASVVLVVALLALTAGRFRRDEEWLVLYTLGKTSKKHIRGSWTMYPYQYEFGDWVVFFAVPLINHAVRVKGELQGVWEDMRDALPFGVKVARPSLDRTRGVWSVRAQGIDDDARDWHTFDVEGSGLTEVAALEELVGHLRVAVTAARRTAPKS
jgi:hypothetical protein